MANTQLSEVDLQELNVALAELSESGTAQDAILKAYREIASPDLDSRISDAFGHALVRSIDANAKSGFVLSIAKLFKEERRLPEEARARLEPAYLEGIGVCAKNGRIMPLLKLFKMKGLPEKARGHVEPALLEAMDVCAKNGGVDILAKLSQEEGLPEEARARMEPALLEGIDAWAKLDHTGIGSSSLSEAMFSVVFTSETISEAVSLKIINVCSNPKQICFVATLLENNDLSEEACLKGIVACAKAGETNAIAALLRKRGGLPESVVDAVERALKGSNYKEDPRDVLSQITAKLRQPPKAPAATAPKKVRRAVPGK